jgi:hypothetical protein
MKPDKRKHSLNREHTLTALACFGVILGVEAIAQADVVTSANLQLSPALRTSAQETNHILWQNAQLSSSLKIDEGMSRSQMQQSLKSTIAADPMLGELYSFRQTLRGTGPMALRKWTLAGNGKNSINLELGAHALPGLSLAGLSGSQSSVGIGGQSFGFYTSAPVSALNRSLASYDAMLGDKNIATLDQTKMTWVQFQPLHSKTAGLQFVWASGEKDLNPTTEAFQSLRGSLWGVQGNYALPILANWSLNGQWVKSNVGNSDGATAWQAKLAGPIHHPLGTAQLSAVYTNIDPGFESFAGSSLENGRITKSLALSQPLGKGALTANLGLSWNQIERIGQQNLSLPRTDSTFNSILSVRWQLTSSVALTAKHSLTKDTDELYPGSVFSLQNHSLEDTQAGIEVKVSPSLLLNFGAGMNSNQIQQQHDSTLNSTYDNNSNYLTVGVKNKMASGTIGVDLQRDFAQDALAQDENKSLIISLNAQQQLAPWLNVGGKVRLANDSPMQPTSTILNKPADLTANAQISLDSLGAVQLSYSQWNLQNALDANDNDTANAYQISYLLGARNGQEGLGLSLAYSYSAARNPQNTLWKVGLTYR